LPLPHRRWDEALAVLTRLGSTHRGELMTIGNGRASRETDQLATELARRLGLAKAVVSAASASAYASHELPELEMSLRGAVSIARRLRRPARGTRQDRSQKLTSAAQRPARLP